MKCYILIGGASSRMGRSKVELFFDGVARVAGEVFEEVVAVDRADSAVRGVVYERPHEARAPIFGVQRALEHAGARCFILAVDYPLLTPEVLRYVVARAEERPRALIVAPEWSGRAQFLCAVWSAAALPRIEERIAASRYDLRGIAAAGEAEIIAESELRARFAGEPLSNVNTPEDLEAIRK